MLWLVTVLLLALIFGLSSYASTLQHRIETLRSEYEQGEHRNRNDIERLGSKVSALQQRVEALTRPDKVDQIDDPKAKEAAAALIASLEKELSAQKFS
jgi:hypothetical protein